MSTNSDKQLIIEGKYVLILSFSQFSFYLNV